MSGISIAIERGNRVKRCRNIANLTREAMCHADDISIMTLKGWELGKYGGINEAGAQRVLARVKKEAVRCSLNWLMTGAGIGPVIVYNQTT